jgi:N-acetylglucosaminyl-diphospho-decaprenol L-rhamnosyltransferase
MRSATVVVPTTNGHLRLRALMRTLAGQTVEHQVVVIDNGSSGAGLPGAGAEHPNAQVIRLERNAGFSRAVNLGVARAEGDAVIMVNDDCTCDPAFVENLVAALDPARGVIMSGGVLRDRAAPELIETAGMVLDSTLLVSDYLNGEPLSRLERAVADPIGPCGAAAAFDRSAFLEVGGFDERLFAYWEDVDLVLRLRRAGGRCALAPGARGAHEHSATLGPGSPRKNYLAGFGRAYVLRKWGVLRPRRLPGVIARELGVCLGQGLVDHNLAGVRGRLRGFLAATPTKEYPADLLPAGASTGTWDALRRRAARRTRIRRRREATAR